MWKIKRSTIVHDDPLPRLFLFWRRTMTAECLSRPFGKQKKAKEKEENASIFLYICFKTFIWLACQHLVTTSIRTNVPNEFSQVKQNYKVQTETQEGEMKWTCGIQPSTGQLGKTKKTGCNTTQRVLFIWGQIMGWNQNVGNVLGRSWTSSNS